MFLFVTTCSSLLGQQVRVPNLSASYLPQTYPLFNPASINAVTETDKGSVLLSHKQGTGVFSVFSQNYFNANLCFGTDSVKKHAVGIRILNDQAGKYISLNRVALLYSYSLVLSERYSLNLGLAPTITNFRKKAQNFGGSATKGNLDLGLWFTTNKLMLGASINQIIENELAVIEEITLIKSQYVLNAKYNHRIQSFVSLDYQFFYKINTGLSNEEVFGLTMNYYKHIRIGVNYEHSGSIYFLSGLKDFSFSKLSGKLSLDFIYGLAVAKRSYTPRNVVELMMNYEF